jgi:hypothetical protein
MDWRKISRKGIIDIERVVDLFEVTISGENIRHFTFRIKILESRKGTYTGFSNFSVKNRKTGFQEYYSGYGNSIDEALEATINEFMDLIDGIDNIKDEDFIWIPNEEFL